MRLGVLNGCTLFQRRLGGCLVLLAAVAGMAAPGVAQQSVVIEGTSARVVGLVYDSIALAALPGVSVQFVSADSASGRGFASRTDSAGHYSIDSMPPGTYLAGFFLMSSDTLGFESAPRRVEIRPGAQRIDLATASPGTVIKALCPGSEADSTGLLIGHVRATDSQQPLHGASVLVEWRETIIGGRFFTERAPRVVVQTSGPGWFAMCDLPSDVVMSARAAHGADSSGYIDVEVPPDGLRHVTFFVGGATAVDLPRARRAAGNDTTPLSVLRGHARLTGTVRDSEGRPVENARAVVWGTELEAVTNDRGAFVLENLPGGTHTLEVRAIRREPARKVVHLSAQRPASTDMVIGARTTVLSSVTIRGELVYSRNLEAFEARRSEGWELVGQFLGPAELAKRPGARLSSLLQGFPGVTVQTQRGETSVRMREKGSSTCVPSLYVDGMRDVVADFNSLSSDQLAGVEVYVRDAWRPFEFIDSNDCGAVAVWTRPPQVKIRKN